MPIAAPSTTLAMIQKKVRRLTRSPSTSQLSDDDLNDYVNTFVLYDMPSSLKLTSFYTTFSFYCNPYQDRYVTDDPFVFGSELDNFRNKYIAVFDPIYIDGVRASFSQNRNEFYSSYPLNTVKEKLGTGDGITTAFGATITQRPFMQNNVTIVSVGINDNGLVLVDIPSSNVAGYLVKPGTTISLGTINYVTGVYAFDFGLAPKAAASVEAQIAHYNPQRPTSLLYFNNEFTLRPIPDKPYKINMEVYARPTYFMETTDAPYLEQWWQYIAYGAAKKIFEDRSDMESIQLIVPELKSQENLILYRTINQQSSNRVATIFDYQSGSSEVNNGI